MLQRFLRSVAVAVWGASWVCCQAAETLGFEILDPHFEWHNWQSQSQRECSQCSPERPGDLVRMLKKRLREEICLKIWDYLFDRHKWTLQFIKKVAGLHKSKSPDEHSQHVNVTVITLTKGGESQDLQMAGLGGSKDVEWNTSDTEAEDRWRGAVVNTNHKSRQAAKSDILIDISWYLWYLDVMFSMRVTWQLSLQHERTSCRTRPTGARPSWSWLLGSRASRAARGTRGTRPARPPSTRATPARAQP